MSSPLGDSPESPVNVTPSLDDPALDDPRVVRAVQEYQAALETGRRPNRQEFLARHAEIAAALSECLEALEFLHTVGPRLEEPDQPPPAGEDFDLASPLGDFRLVRELGRGGMGVVYEAEQLSLGRRIALKVLPFAFTLDPRQLQRFKNEARAAAQLHHSNIVPVYAVGCERGVHFYAMQYIEGQSLAAVLRDFRALAGVRAALGDSPGRIAGAAPVSAILFPLADRPGGETVHGQQLTTVTGESLRSPLYFRAAAQLCAQAAEALEHAHQLGVVHRDVKPANLMLDTHGQLWVTDFGLAQFQSDAALTLTGDLLGTLRYMSPEQALARRGLVDHRTDIYSLGATLYELLTLEPALPGRNRGELLRQIAFDEPKPPRRLNRAIPADLETIVLRAMAKGVEERYSTARELADDLRRFLENKPIHARPPSVRERLGKWARRHKAAVVSAAVLLLLAAVGLAISTAVIAREQMKTQSAYQRLAEEQERVRAAYEAEVRERAQAERSFRQARQAVDLLSQISEEELAGRPELQELRRRLLEWVLAYYRDFIEQRGDDPAVREDLVESHMRVAGILQKIGSRADALAAVEQARKIQERLLKDHPNAQEYQRGLSSIYSHLDWLRDGSPFFLLTQRSVQKELKLSEEQVKTIAQLSDGRRETFRDSRNLSPEEWRTRLEELAAREERLVKGLDADQDRRLRQIALQQRGISAFGDPDVARGLALTAEQKERIRKLQSETNRPFPREPGRFGGWQVEEWKRIEERLLNVLTDEQKVCWKELKGEAFQGEIRHGLSVGPPGFWPGRGGPRRH